MAIADQDLPALFDTTIRQHEEAVLYREDTVAGTLLWCQLQHRHQE